MTSKTISSMEMIKNTHYTKIFDIEAVKDKFISNWQSCNPGTDAEVMWSRNVLSIRLQMQNWKKRNKATGQYDKVNIDPINFYYALMTIAAYGWSVLPEDKMVYLIPKGDALLIWPQANAKVLKLQKSNQIVDVQHIGMVYKNDTFIVKNGKVVEHTRCFDEDVRLKAGYVIFQLPGGAERHMIYEPHQWEQWRQRSPEKDGVNWNAEIAFTDKNGVSGKHRQPEIGFLETKLLSHASDNKTFTTTAQLPVNVEVYQQVVVSDEEVKKEDLPQFDQHEDMDAATATEAQKALPESTSIPYTPIFHQQPTPTKPGINIPSSLNDMP